MTDIHYERSPHALACAKYYAKNKEVLREKARARMRRQRAAKNGSQESQCSHPTITSPSPRPGAVGPGYKNRLNRDTFSSSFPRRLQGNLRGHARHPGLPNLPRGNSLRRADFLRKLQRSIKQRLSKSRLPSSPSERQTSRGFEVTRESKAASSRSIGIQATGLYTVERNWDLPPSSPPASPCSSDSHRSLPVASDSELDGWNPSGCARNRRSEAEILETIKALPPSSPPSDYDD